MFCIIQCKLSIFSSGGHSVEESKNLNICFLNNFVRAPPKEHLCEIISNFGHSFSSRCCLKVFLFLALVAILFSEVEQFEQFW